MGMVVRCELVGCVRLARRTTEPHLHCECHRRVGVVHTANIRTANVMARRNKPTPAVVTTRFFSPEAEPSLMVLYVVVEPCINPAGFWMPLIKTIIIYAPVLL